MWIKITRSGLSNDYESKSNWIGALFIIIGSVAGIYASFSKFEPAVVISVMLLTSGLISAYLTSKMNPHITVSWMKTFLLIVFGILFLFYPYDERGTPLFISTAYFLAVMLCDILLAYETRQTKTALAWLSKALFLALFALLVISQALSVKTTGLFIALTLIFDGLCILYSGRKVFIRP